jgi:2-polyprenyl-3-methyl-5-hydroxy-6-metoxy-1,4-benzoquinol methylase
MTEYVLGSDSAEIARLDLQAASIAGPTEGLLRAAGIEPGMRVLDLGTGLGHVAAQLAALVGPTGAVVGVDREAPLLAIAQQRHASDTVRFVEADVHATRFDEPFDAVVCRLLLFHLPDAVDVLALHRRESLRPGGTMVAIDYDIGGARCEPPVALAQQALGWVEAAFRAADANPRVGARLVMMLREASFSDAQTFGIQGYIAPGDPTGPALLAGTVRSLHEPIVAAGIATAEEIGLETLEERLGRDLEAANAVLLPPTVVGAWGRA